MRRFLASRLLLWLVLALPGLWIGWRWAMMPHRYGFGHAVADSGNWAAWYLLGTLAIAPLGLAMGAGAFTIWLARRRRDFGVASFVYAAGHTAIYVADKPALARVIEEAGEAGLLTGWLALALFLPLAATSNDVAVRRMRGSWKRLHRLVHPAALLVFAHWALTAFDPITAYWHIAILAAIEAAGIALQRRQRVT
jgi:sulfoxide reductase heme-binding subunit YedZ